MLAIGVSLLVLLVWSPSAQAQSCDEDANCTANQLCNDDGDCEDEPCERDVQCGQNGICLDSGRCGNLSQCYRDSDCGGGGWWCNDGYGCSFEEVFCELASDCAFSLPCTEGRCRQPGCSRDNECTNNTICVAGECLSIDQGCGIDRNCPLGQVCRNDGACIEPEECVRDEACELDELCSDERECVPYFLDVDPPPTPCRNADDCRANQICFEGSCVASPDPAPLCGQGGLAAMVVLLGCCRRRKSIQ